MKDEESNVQLVDEYIDNIDDLYEDEKDSDFYRKRHKVWKILKAVLFSAITLCVAVTCYGAYATSMYGQYNDNFIYLTNTKQKAVKTLKEMNEISNWCEELILGDEIKNGIIKEQPDSTEAQTYLKNFELKYNAVNGCVSKYDEEEQTVLNFYVSEAQSSSSFVFTVKEANNNPKLVKLIDAYGNCFKETYNDVILYLFLKAQSNSGADVNSLSNYKSQSIKDKYSETMNLIFGA